METSLCMSVLQRHTVVKASQDKNDDLFFGEGRRRARLLFRNVEKMNYLSTTEEIAHFQISNGKHESIDLHRSRMGRTVRVAGSFPGFFVQGSVLVQV
mmetsp:Transcript_30/g.74  ORF Transcript_30/g.74 Transcript_30/m.74 type:complete len:98 (+) Transcript_30:367-660(+)